MTGSHATYNVGPGKTYTELTNVPWLSLQAGDVVNIHYRAEPYRTKIGLRAQGTAQAPVVINGVTSDTCQRPVLNAENAVTATDSRTAGFGRDIQGAGLIQIYRSPTDPYDTFTPRYITIQNLMLTGAKGGKNFKDNAGANASYGTFSAAIYAVRVHNLTVENCAITGNGLGVFTNTKGDTQDSYSADIIIRRNRIYDNGYTTDDHEHNLYIQARRALYEGNYIGQAFAGSSIKDRSSGTVIRYNMILASARAIDLVETEEEYFSNVEPDPLYNYAWVYGNIIVNDSQLPGGSFSGNIVHWGFDNNPAKSHAGTLFFYQNTLINRVPQSSFWYTNIFQLGKDGTVPTGIKAEISSNVFWQQGGNEWRFLTDKGTLQFMGTNYVPTNWSASVPGQSADVRTQGSTLITGLDPNLDASFTPLSGAPVLGKAIVAPSTTPTGATAANLQVAHQYKEGVGIVALPARLTGSSGAIGALQRP
ncbi:MAG: hypothetical protein EPO09_15065 [Aquabacterium sp.]|uniref:hypothetical protein n=1 Tax=Aquabacterium sp. TaxID=1872578 RepID=UPI001215B386|nr:hypothetical protein [Aquabacterium sp.]TAK92659.1 MAG: hypothetical protein EPO09_15065 [Aquabacterium sp.]